jgi:hypothetical protein
MVIPTATFAEGAKVVRFLSINEKACIVQRPNHSIVITERYNDVVAINRKFTATCGLDERSEYQGLKAKSGSITHGAKLLVNTAPKRSGITRRPYRVEVLIPIVGQQFCYQIHGESVRRGGQVNGTPCTIF